MKTIKGDLINLAERGEYDIIVHGCNCFVTMSAGIAKSIKEKWPHAYEADRETVPGDKDKLGQFTFTTATAPTKTGILFIINAYTQFEYWKTKNKKTNVNYTAIQEVFHNIKASFGERNLKFGIPKIGAGLAGGDWNIIEPLIEKEMQGENIEVVEYEKK